MSDLLNSIIKSMETPPDIMKFEEKQKIKGILHSQYCTL